MEYLGEGVIVEYLGALLWNKCGRELFWNILGGILA